jgi:succinate-semialdehyde dehydrogenase/glutarate-semialdehyde dehydrogenase
MKTIISVNPATGEILREFRPHSDEDIEHALIRAVRAFEAHRQAAFPEKGRALIRAAEILESDKASLAKTITLEMGKPIRAAISEVEKCALACRYYAANAESFLRDEEVEVPGTRSFIRCQPIGIVLAIMPWNFPFWQVFRFAAPALMAGNAALLKHASNVPECALAIEKVFRESGFPEGTFQALLIGPDRATRLIEDPRISAVTLTGSVGAGSQVASAAGRHIKKTVLELGGSDPFIVTRGADLDGAVTAAVQARTLNNGQSCIAAKRFIVDQKIAAEFERRFVARMASLKMGDPMDESVDLGPLATADILRALEEQVQESVKRGARILLGGKRAERSGNFFPPTVLVEAPPDSPAYKDELFGPVAVLFRVDGIEEALRLANDTQFGLGACLWSKDPRETDFFIDQIQAGLAFVNGMVASSPPLPFGGIKKSGYGRELGRDGIREFVNIKTVSIHSPDGR